MYKTINGWTKERMKARIMKRMLNHPAKNDKGCSYKADDGNRCAIGVFIPLGHDCERFGNYVHALLEQYPDLTRRMPLNVDPLSEMQGVHDGIADDLDPRPILCKWIDENVEDGK